MSRRYFITEVFAEGSYSGNQLATVIDCDGLSTQEMQNIARGFNFAETTFFLGGSLEAGYDVRIFTPAAELPFAGHPTIGTAYLIKYHLDDVAASQLTLNLGVGPIAVRFEDDDVIWMRQNAPVFGCEVEPDAAAESVGLLTNDLHGDRCAQHVSTGLEFVIVPVKDLITLQRARIVHSDDDNNVGILAFCDDGYRDGHQFASRMFAPGLGVGEDAATGSATGCLAAYLAQYQIGTSQQNASELHGVVGQGFEIGRPSALHMYSNAASHPFVVEVGGRVNLVAQGDWLL